MAIPALFEPQYWHFFDSVGIAILFSMQFRQPPQHLVESFCNQPSMDNPCTANVLHSLRFGLALGSKSGFSSHLKNLVIHTRYVL